MRIENDSNVSESLLPLSRIRTTTLRYPELESQPKNRLLEKNVQRVGDDVKNVFIIENVK